MTPRSFPKAVSAALSASDAGWRNSPRLLLPPRPENQAGGLALARLSASTFNA